MLSRRAIVLRDLLRCCRWICSTRHVNLSTCRNFRISSILLSRSRRQLVGRYALNLKGSKRALTSDSPQVADPAANPSRLSITHVLITCPGCGALAQTVEPGKPGYYDDGRKSIRSFLDPKAFERKRAQSQRDDDLVASALTNVDPAISISLGLNTDEDRPKSDRQTSDAEVLSETPVGEQLPLCDRCHQLVHHHTGTPIQHPSVEDIQDTISESPYKYNHIYHVLDAADFPMSLVHGLDTTLRLSERSKNRRARHDKFYSGQRTDISYIITRSDLLAPKKAQVDRLLPYLRDILREALGSAGRDLRLNVHCVSAKRGWWTRDVKADIWNRGGAIWMVGKVNVGKSYLFESVFPKGHTEDINFDRVRSIARTQALHGALGAQTHQLTHNESGYENFDTELASDLLPPARSETPYPVMPTVSALPGTTASPIRIPFGNKRGELIDLPGLARTEIEKFVLEEDKTKLVMKARVVPEQQVIKPGQSLLLDGLIRITPVTKDQIFLAYPFVPLGAHLTATLKALEVEDGASERQIPSILDHSAVRSLSSAGTFKLQWDVTKQRAGPLTTKSAAGLKPEKLAFQVFSADILIESVGWVEIVAQVRRRDHLDLTGNFPEVEIFSPEGKFISVRKPIGGWILGGSATKPRPASKRKTRPRRSIASLKSRIKG